MPLQKASEIHKRVKRIIACGPIRTGKTLGFCTLPGRKIAWVFDPNAADTLREYSPDCDVFMYLPTGTNLNAQSLTAGRKDSIVSVKPPEEYNNFIEEFDHFLGDPSCPFYYENYDAVLLDGMTAFQNVVLDRITAMNGHYGKQPEQADWTAAMNTITNVIRRITSTDRLFYLTVHTDYKDVKFVGPSEVLNMIGQLKNTLPGLFTDIWHFTATLDEKNRPTFNIQTRSDDTKRILGTSMQNLPVHTNVTLDFSKPIENQGVAAMLKLGGFYA